MNDTAMIFVLSLASNNHPEQHFKQAFRHIMTFGEAKFSPIYLIPCRDAVGADYWNAACIVKTKISVLEMTDLLKKMEHESGRVRPSHQISLDVDLIAWGTDLAAMQFNPKKLPLALDVKVPLQTIWNNALLRVAENYPVIDFGL